MNNARREPGGGGLSRWSATLRALRHRNFKLFFTGQLISVVGTWMQSLAQAWLVYRLTGSSLLLGSVGFAGQIPVLVFGSLGGTAADRYSRHRLVIATQTSAMLLAFVLSALTLAEAVSVWHIFVLAALLGIVNAFDMPARQAFIVEMVGKEDLMNAIALNSSMFNGARVLGPAVAGILVATIGEGWCFFANGISYIAVIAGLLMMKLPPMQRVSYTGSALSNILEGFQFVRKARPIRALLLLLGLISLVGMPYAVLMPIFADQILHGGAGGMGILMGATGVGALGGALMLASRTGVEGLGRWAGYACAGFGISLILFTMSRSFWLSVLILLPVGFTMMVQMGASNTLIQTMVPDTLRGRIMAFYSMTFMGMAPFGSILAGVLAERLGAPITVFLGAVVCVLGAAVYISRIPSLRASARQLIASQGIVQTAASRKNY
jgi:MFS family permease